MSERYYVGARYVPKYAEPLEWQENLAYEPLTIVQDGTGLYTSKKPVPASVGKPSENNDYWAMTGSTAGATDELEEQVKQNTAAIAAETTARTDADAAITESISTETSARVSADNALNQEIVKKVENVTITNENGIYTLKETINGEDSEIGSIEVPEDNNPVVETKDTVVENTTSGYDFHTLTETTADGTEQEIGKMYIARDQITDIAISDGSLAISGVDQSGNATSKALDLPAGATLITATADSQGISQAVSIDEVSGTPTRINVFSDDIISGETYLAVGGYWNVTNHSGVQGGLIFTYPCITAISSGRIQLPVLLEPLHDSIEGVTDVQYIEATCYLYKV